MTGKTVLCKHHGEQQATYVCRHVVDALADRTPRGFHSSGEEPSSTRPDAWCSACQAFLDSHSGDWDDESERFARITLICGVCYDLAQAINVGQLH